MADVALFTALAERFPLHTITRTFAGRSFTITCVRDQDALLSGVTDEKEVETFPFGLLLWASGIGLAEHLAAEPRLVAEKRVLEIGAGVGLPGFVAAHLGAAEVVQTDYHAEALALLEQNARANGVNERIHRAWADWRAFPKIGQPFEVVIGSDVLYERTLHESLLTLLPRLVVPGGLLLLADPIRPQALAFIERLEQEYAADWELPVTMTGRRVIGINETREIALFSLRRKYISSP